LRKTVDLAEETSEHPSFGQIVNKTHPRAEQCHHNVCHSEVDDEVVGSRVHALVAPDGEHH